MTHPSFSALHHARLNVNIVPGTGEETGEPEIKRLETQWKIPFHDVFW
jgi:hypothetical protein